MDLRRQCCWKDAYLTVPEGKKTPAFLIWICLTDRPGCFFLWKVYTLGYSAVYLAPDHIYYLSAWNVSPSCKAWVIVPRSVQGQTHIISYLLWEKGWILKLLWPVSCVVEVMTGAEESLVERFWWENKNSPHKVEILMHLVNLI